MREVASRAKSWFVAVASTPSLSSSMTRVPTCASGLHRHWKSHQQYLWKLLCSLRQKEGGDWGIASREDLAAFKDRETETQQKNLGVFNRFRTSMLETLLQPRPTEPSDHSFPFPSHFPCIVAGNLYIVLVHLFNRFLCIVLFPFCVHCFFSFCVHRTPGL